MRSSARQQILMAALVGCVAWAAIPQPVGGAQEDWIEQIAQQIREQRRETTDPAAASAYDRYLVQLRRVQQAFAQGETLQVQREMARLVATVGTTKSGIGDSPARHLLAFIGGHTPFEYLDRATRSHLRLIVEMEREVAATKAARNPPMDPYFSSLGKPRQQARSWTSWIYGWVRNAESHPLILVGAGALFLVGIGVVAMLFIALGVGAPRSKDSTQFEQIPGHADRQEAGSTGPEQGPI